MRRLIVLGGVPGSGKSTTLRRVPREGPDGVPGTADDVQVLDPEDLHRWWAHRLPPTVPYRLYRPLVHTGHGARVVAHLLAGALSGRPDHPVVVHDPATRGWRRRLLIMVARWCGYAPELVVIGVSPDEASEGQRIRGRELSDEANQRHWAGHQRMRTDLVAEEWVQIHHTDRAGVGALLRSLVGPRPTAPARPPQAPAESAAAATTTPAPPGRTRRR